MSAVKKLAIKKRGRRTGSQDFVYIEMEFAKRVLEKLGGHPLDKSFSVSRVWLEDCGFQLMEVCNNVSLTEHERERGHSPTYRFSAAKDSEDPRAFFKTDVELYDHPHDSSVRVAGAAEASRLEQENLKSVLKLDATEDGVERRGHQTGSTEAHIRMSAIKRILADKEIYDEAHKLFYLLKKKAKSSKWETVPLGQLRREMEKSFFKLDALIKAAQSNKGTFEDFLSGVFTTYPVTVGEGRKIRVLSDQGGLAGDLSSGLAKDLRDIDLSILRAFMKATEDMGDSLPLVKVRGFIDQRRKVSKKGILIKWGWLEARSPLTKHQAKKGIKSVRVSDSESDADKVVPDLRLAYNVNQSSDFDWVYEPDFHMSPKGTMTHKERMVKSKQQSVS